MIKIVKNRVFTKDVRNGEFDVACVIWNCESTPNDPLSINIIKSFPNILKADKQKKEADFYKMGEYTYLFVKELQLKLVLLYCKYKPHSIIEYTALALSIRNLAQTLRGDEVIGIHLPKCQYPDVFKQILEIELGEYDVKLYG